MALTAQQVQQFYIGYYARPADPIGLAYWQTQDEASALAGFSGSAEFTAQFAGMSISQQVTKVYGNLLGRAPDATGLLYWAGEISAGRETIGTLVMSMITNALGKDVTTIADRVEYSTAFTAAINTVDEINAYAGTAATEAARAALLKVVSTAVGDHTALTAETAKIDATISAIVSGGTTSPGQPFTLTTGADAGAAFTGTTGNDTYTAGETGNAKTLTAGDNIQGGDGVDTLNVSAASTQNYAGFTTAGVEVINAISDAAQTFDLSGATGLTTVKSSNSANAATFNEVTNLVDVEVVSLTNTNAVSNVTVQFQAPVVAGATDAVKLTLNNSNAQNIVIGNTANAVAGIETVNLVATGANSTVAALNTNLTTLNFTGDKNVAIAAALNNTVSTINAADATGGLTVSTNTVNALAFTGGAGDDQVTFAAGTLTVLDTVVGGAGNDRLVANQADLIASSTRVSQVEYIRVQDTLTGTQGADTPATNLDGAKFADATRIELAQGYNAARLDNLNAVQQRVDILADRVGGNLGTLQIDDGATSSVADQFTLALGTSHATAPSNVNANVQFVSGEIETVNLISNGNNAIAVGNVLNLSAGATNGMANVTTLNISGVEDLAVTTAASRITTVAAGDATGALNLVGVQYSATAGATITTGSGADRVQGSARADTVNLGAGNDVYIASAGADSITLGDGNDTVNYTALDQSNSTNTDTIVDFVSGTDIIDLSGLGATAYAGSKASFDLAQGALTGGGVVSAVFDQAAGRLWVDMDGNGTLDGNDLRVNLTGVTALAASSLTLGGGNNFAVNVGVANPGNAFNNTFTSTSAADFAAGALTTVDGVSGTDTLAITVDQGGAATLVGRASNIDRVSLTAAQTGLTIHNEAGVLVTSTGTAATTVTLGAATAQSYTGNAQVDNVTLGFTGQIVNGAGGNDVITSTAANLMGANIDGGAGADTLTLADAGANDISTTTGTLTSVESLQLNAAGVVATTMTVAQYNSFTTSVLLGNVGDGVTFSNAGTATVAAATTAVVYQLAAAGNTLNIGTVAGDFVVTGAAGNDRVNIASSVLTAADTFNGVTGTDTFAVTVNGNLTLAAGNISADNIDNVILSGTAATATTGLNFTFQEAANTGLTSVDLTGLTNGGTIGMGNLATAAQTINALNGAADVITGSTVAAGVTTTVSLGNTDTFDNASLTGTSDTVIKAYGIANGTTAITVNTTVDFDATDLTLSFFNAAGTQVNVAGVGAWAAGFINATATLVGTDTVISLDADANGILSNGDITVTIVGQDLTGGGLGLAAGSIVF